MSQEERIKELEEALTGMCYQFAYWRGGGFSCGGLSALESAFMALGWDDPHPAKDAQCQIEGCKEQATCGTPTKDGRYKNVCSKHYSEIQKEILAAKAVRAGDKKDKEKKE